MQHRVIVRLLVSLALATASPVSAQEPRLLATLAGHSAHVNCVVFHPNGQLLASASHDETVMLWDVAARKVTNTLQHKLPVEAIAFIQGGGSLASGTRQDGDVHLWQMGTVRHLGKPFRGGEYGVYALAWSQSGNKFASGSLDYIVRLWDFVGKDQKLEQIDLGGSTGAAIYALAFSPDGKILASAGGNAAIRLWDAPGGKLITAMVGENGHGIASLAFSPDGKTLASIGAKLELWDVASRKVIRTMAGSRALAFSPDGKTLATGSEDKTIKLWDVATGKNTATLHGHTNHVKSLAFSPDGLLLASGSHDHTIKLWEIPAVPKADP